MSFILKILSMKLFTKLGRNYLFVLVYGYNFSVVGSERVKVVQTPCKSI